MDPPFGDVPPRAGIKSHLGRFFGNYSLPVHIDAIRRVSRMGSGNPDLSARGPSVRRDRWPAGTIRPSKSGQRARFGVLYLLPDLLSMRTRTRPGQTSLLT